MGTHLTVIVWLKTRQPCDEDDHDEEEGGDHHAALRVGKVELGAQYEVPLTRRLALGIGASYAKNFVPEDAEAVYGGDPDGVMGFLRLKIR